MQSTCESKFNQRALLIGAPGVSLTKRQKLKKIAPPPPVPTWVFEAERSRAFAPDTPTSLIPLDLSAVLQTPGPATTPSLLACYLRVRSQETLKTQFQAGIEFYYVIQGRGRTCWQNEEIVWKSGDLFFLAGGQQVQHHAENEDCLLYVLNDEPLATFLYLQAMAPERRSFDAVHYLAEDVYAAQAEILQETQQSGVLHFGVDDRVVYSSFFPAWKWIIPGEQQTPHRHASVAIQLFVGHSKSHSLINGQRVDWQDGAVAVSPAGSLHSHHNDGDNLGIYLVTQDFPLHKYLRTYWYEEPDSNVYLRDW